MRPAGEEFPIFLDIATSATASTKVHAAKDLGKSIPEGWITNAEGLPTTEIGDWPAVGSLLPMAGHKGYGLALLVEVLAGVMSGSSFTLNVKRWLGNLADPPGTGHTFIAIDVGQMLPIGEFKQRMDEMIRNIKNTPKAKGADRIWLPGEMEWERRKVALREGILLPEIVLKSLAKLAVEVGRDFQDLFV